MAAYPTATIASNRRFSFEPGAKWHGFEGYVDDQYFVDPKPLLRPRRIDADSGRYTEFGILPATILAHYLRENGIGAWRSISTRILFC